MSAPTVKGLAHPHHDVQATVVAVMEDKSNLDCETKRAKKSKIKNQNACLVESARTRFCVRLSGLCIPSVLAIPSWTQLNISGLAPPPLWATLPPPRCVVEKVLYAVPSADDGRRPCGEKWRGQSTLQTRGRGVFGQTLCNSRGLVVFVS